MQGRGCQFRRLDDTHVIRERAERELRIRHQPSDDFFWGGETYPVVLGKLWRKIRFCFCCWQKRFMSCFVCETWWGRMIAQSVCLQKDLQKVCIYLFFFPSLSRRCSFSHWCQPCLWDETEFRSAPQHYCLLASLAQWPPFCQTFRARLESF